jgi:putative transposase
MAKWVTDWKKVPETEWLKEAYTDNLQQKLKDLDTAWQRYFKKVGDAQRPRFKKKGRSRDSIRFVNFAKYCKLERRRVKLPSGLGWVKFRKSPANWQKQKARINRIHTRIASVRRDALHKTSTTISKNHAMIVIEDLKVSNMSRSAKGTTDNPGTHVAAKSGLNRSILDQGWHEFRRQLTYKQAFRGGEVLAVPAHYTRQTCPACQHISTDNRKTQARFECVECGFSENADRVGAINIKARGHRVLACGETALAAR